MLNGSFGKGQTGEISVIRDELNAGMYMLFYEASAETP